MQIPQQTQQTQKQNFIQNRNYEMFMNFNQMNQYQKNDQMMSANYNYRMPMNIYGMQMGMEQGGGMFSYSPFTINKNINQMGIKEEDLNQIPENIQNNPKFNNMINSGMLRIGNTNNIGNITINNLGNINLNFGQNIPNQNSIGNMNMNLPNN